MNTIDQVYQVMPDLRECNGDQVAHLVGVFCQVAPTLAALTPLVVATWVRAKIAMNRMDPLELQQLARAEIDVRAAMKGEGEHHVRAPR